MNDRGRDPQCPGEALQDYFDALLAMPQAQPGPKVPSERPAQPAAQVKIDPVRPAGELPLRERSAAEQLAREKLARLLTSTPALAGPEKPARFTTDSRPTGRQQEIAITSPAIAVADAVCESPAVDSLEWKANGRPAWAQRSFDALLFEVAGLTLAVPLIALGHILPLTDELTPLFGQADWFMGVQPTPMGGINTVNTSLLVMPERYNESFLVDARYIVTIHGSSWGLAVNKVNPPIELQPEDVKWRSDRSKRPWLAGTVKQHMCALLDVRSLGRMLQASGASTHPAR